MVGPLNKAEQKRLARETEARKKLEKKLASVAVKNAEANNPGKEYRAIPVDSGVYTDYLTIITGDEPFAFAVTEPYQHSIKDTEEKVGFRRRCLYEPFTELITKLKLIEAGKFKPRATAQELKKLKKNIEDLRHQLYYLSTGFELEDLMQELAFTPDKIDRLIKDRQSKMKPSKYPDEIVKVTAHLVEYWCNLTYDDPINAHSKGNSYDRAGVKDAVAKENLKTIDVTYNPGGAFIQRVLKTYFNLTLNNTQLKTLLGKANKIADIKYRKLNKKQFPTSPEYW